MLRVLLGVPSFQGSFLDLLEGVQKGSRQIVFGFERGYWDLLSKNFGLRSGSM